MGESLLWRISLTLILFRLCYAFILAKKKTPLACLLLFISSHISCSKASAVLKGCAISPDTSQKGLTQGCPVVLYGKLHIWISVVQILYGRIVMLFGQPLPVSFIV